MIDSTTNFVEHPKLVAQRIGRYADIVGRERVIAGVDCGFGTAVRTDPIVADSIVWAKLKALGEGAAIASRTAVGLEGGVMTIGKALHRRRAVADVVAAPVHCDRQAVRRASATKIKVQSQALWHGYGYLPGYRPSLAEINGLPVLGSDPRREREWRYFDCYGNAHYGWGAAGILSRPLQRRQLRPVLDLTPIGMMPTCGQSISASQPFEITPLSARSPPGARSAAAGAGSPSP